MDFGKYVESLKLPDLVKLTYTCNKTKAENCIKCNCYKYHGCKGKTEK